MLDRYHFLKTTGGKMDDEVTRSCLAADLQGVTSLTERTNGHPDLTLAERNLLAERIALADGVAFDEAHRQIEEMLGSNLNGS
jgi:hypothetical protein